MLHTPPTKGTFVAGESAEGSTAEPFTDPLHATSEESIAVDESSVSVELPQQLVPELQQLVSQFLHDVQQPKYNKPLTAEQLSDMFQDFYQMFQYRVDLFVKGSVYYKNRLKEIEMLTAEEQVQRKKILLQVHLKIRRYVQLGEDDICTSLFDKLFNKFPEDVEINNYIKKKIALMKRIKDLDYCKLLDVNMKLTPELDSVSHIFSELCHLKTPCDKLDVLLSIHASINSTLLKQVSHVDGDYILPILIYLILVNEDDVDFYLNLMYIKRFRKHSLLVEDSLYCLTNYEAALMYIQSLDLTEDEYDLSELSEEDCHFIKTPLVLKSHPDAKVSPTPTRSIGYALDSGIKSMINRFSSPSPVHEQVASTVDEESYNPLNRLAAGVMKWRNSSEKTPTVTTSTTSTNTFTGRVRSRTNSLQQRVRSQLNLNETPLSNLSTTASNASSVDYSKFKGKQFEDLTISQLKEMYQDYQTLVAQHK